MLLDLTIDALTIGGRGVARHDGKAVFVPGTAPGDLVRCRLVRRHERFDEAEPVDLLCPASVRRTAPCPVFGRCGGCQWQHLHYDAQLHWKERLFREQLLRGAVAAEQAFLPIVPAPAEWHYRNRAQFKCRQSREGFVAGFYRHGSHFVIDTPRCLLVRAEIQALYEPLRRELAAAPCADAIPQVDLGCGDDGRVTAVVHGLPRAAATLRQWLPAVAERLGFSAAIQIGRKSSLELLAGTPDLAMVVDDPPLRLTIGAGGFSQVNSEQNRALVAAVVAAAALSGRERVLDLYCGVGNLTLPLARRAGFVTGVEFYPPAIADAAANARRHGIDNVALVTGAVEEPGVFDSGPCDLVVLDPPRTGAYAVMRRLIDVRPRRIIYVSCDPATLARDLKPLVHHGYAVVSAQAFDLFPQTWHIESVTVLERHPG